MGVPRSIAVSTENVATEIQGWLRDNVTGDREIPLDEPLIENGVLTSLQTVGLVTFLEERFGIIVEDQEFDEENFGSVEAIAGLVASQKTAAGTANSGCVFTTCRATPWSGRGQVGICKWHGCVDGS